MNSGDVVRRRAAACLLAGTVLAAGGCGESPTASLSEGRAARWHDTIAGIRSAAAAADRPTALAALSRLSGYVDRDAQAGQLAGTDAAALKAGIAQARHHLPQPAATPATALAARAPAPPPPPPVSTTQAQTTTATARPPAAEAPASTKDDAKAQKDAAKAQKDIDKAQKESLEAQSDVADAPPTKTKPETVKPKGAEK